MFIINKSDKNRNKELLVIVMAIILVILTTNYYKALKIEKFNEIVSYIPPSGDIQLTDTYDSKNSSIYDFFSEKESLKIMEETYYEVTRNAQIDYYELQLQSVDLIGDYNITEEFTIGEDPSQIKQKNSKGEQVTPVKSIQMSKKCLKKFDLAKSNQVAEQWDCSSDDIIPVLVGSKFENITKKGNIFPAYYLGDKKLKFMVIDSMFPGAYIEINNEKINLDYYIIMPSIDYADNDTEDFKKTLMSVKCEGFIHYETIGDYKQSLKELEKISNNTGFQYDLPQGKKDLDTLFGLGSKIYGGCSIIMIILLVRQLLDLLKKRNYRRNE